MTNVVVDLGNYNIKYYGDRKGSFSAKYSTKFNPNEEMYERIQIDGQTVFIGIGSLNLEFNKIKKNYLGQLLYAINLATNESDINLCLLLPVVQIPNKHDMINKLRGTTFNCVINGNPRTININKVAVLPEGYCGYYSFDESEDTLVIDIGSRTINFAAFCNGKLVESFTEKLGVFNLYSIIKDIQNSTGTAYVEEEIERLISNNKINVDSRIYQDFYDDIINRAKSKVNIETFKVYFVGGGALLLQDIIEANMTAVVHPEAQYANIIGAYRLCQSVWKDLN
ncbi:ParM/StbA family protein [Clostridium saudiense]|uniref:ParM/StbA family protein n=1 Tax=Clostridium saudiense TaxID=1414720 RepID=UPI0018ABAE8A|nr:ParM/StbA family protein [Clostridium saudiense]